MTRPAWPTSPAGPRPLFSAGLSPGNKQRRPDMLNRLRSYIPMLDWGRDYNRTAFQNDMIAAVIVTIMLIPQSLAYALLAGLPPEAGLYASILPIILYAIFGTSRALAVGPVAVVSLMTAAAVGQVAEQGTAGYAVAALTLAVLSGGILLAMGLLKLGFLANFLSHPVDRGLHHRIGCPDRRQPAQAHPRRRGAWSQPARDALDAGREHPGREPDNAGDRRDRDGIPVLGPQGAEALPDRARDEAQGRRHHAEGRPGGRRRRHDARRLGPRPRGSRRGHRGRGSAVPAAVHHAWPVARPRLGAVHPGAADLDHRLRGIDFRRADACGQETPAHRPRPGTDRSGGGQYRRRLPPAATR